MQYKIIFVDDQNAILEALKWMLANESYYFETFGSPLEVLNRIENDEPAVIISDQWMPEMRGTEFLNRVRERWPDTIRIIMSVNLDETVLEAFSHNRVHGLIPKPWSETGLKQIIKNAVKQYQSNINRKKVSKEQTLPTS